MPGTYVPTKPGPADVLIALLMFFGIGAALIVKGREFNSLGATALGILLVVAGIYYTIRYFFASDRDQKD